MRLRNIVLTALAAAALCGCTGKGRAAHAPTIGVFIPGILADSPTYAHFAQGVQDAVAEYNAALPDGEARAGVFVMEAGTNQAEWAAKLTALAATGEYDVIMSSNPSLPELAAPLTAQFPGQKFIIMDGALEGNGSIACVSYDQREQTYLSGYISGLLSGTHRVAVVAAQEYPVMNNVLYPYYARGAADAVAGTACEFRVVGNWYDASRGAEITDALSAAGVDVIMPICGGAAQGVLSSAKEHGLRLAYIDENSFAKGPGTVISSCSTRQDLAAKEEALGFLRGTTRWGTTRVVGLRDGYIEFIQDDPLYIEHVDAGVREQMAALVASLRDGTRTVPEL